MKNAENFYLKMLVEPPDIDQECIHRVTIISSSGFYSVDGKSDMILACG